MSDEVTMSALGASSRDDRPPDAWAVWEGWQGTPDQIAAIVRQVRRHVDPGECSVELDVDEGRQAIDPDHVATDLAPRHQRSFQRLMITGSAPERTIEAEFDNERVKTPGRGVVLRVWAKDRDDAIDVRDTVAVAIDGGRSPLASTPRKGPPASETVDDALVKSERSYRVGVAAIGLGAAGATVAAAILAHLVLDPESALAKIVFFCLCGNRWIGMLIYFALLVVGMFIAAPRIFPQIEISTRSTWSRARGSLLGIVGGTIGIGGVLEVLAQRVS